MNETQRLIDELTKLEDAVPPSRILSEADKTRLYMRYYRLAPALLAKLKRLAKVEAEACAARDGLRLILDGVDESDFYHSTCAHADSVDDVYRALAAGLSPQAQEVTPPT